MKSVWRFYRNFKKCWPYSKKRFHIIKNYHKIIGIDLSRQANMSTPQQVIFVGKVEEDNVATNVFYCWKATLFFFNFSFGSLIVTE